MWLSDVSIFFWLSKLFSFGLGFSLFSWKNWILSKASILYVEKLKLNYYVHKTKNKLIEIKLLRQLNKS